MTETVTSDAPPSLLLEAEALLAAGQPRSALSSMLRQLHLAAQSFATATGMALPPGDAFAVAGSVLGRAARACANPAMASHCQRCVAMLEAARPHVSNNITAIGARAAHKAVAASLGVLLSADAARHVKAGAAMRAPAGEDVLALPGDPATGTPSGRRKLEWPMDPLLAASLFCMLGLAWSGLGLFARTLTLTQGVICCGWFLGMYVAWKARGWARVKAAVARWKSPEQAVTRAVLIGGALAAALLLPMTVKMLRYAPAGMVIDEPSSLVTIIADQHPTTYMYVVDLAAVIAIGLAGAAIATGIRARQGTNQARLASFSHWRSLASVAAMAAWFAVLAWLVAERVYFPGTTFLADAEGLVRVEVGWGWLALGLLGIIAL